MNGIGKRLDLIPIDNIYIGMKVFEIIRNSIYEVIFIQLNRPFNNENQVVLRSLWHGGLSVVDHSISGCRFYYFTEMCE